MYSFCLLSIVLKYGSASKLLEQNLDVYLFVRIHTSENLKYEVKKLSKVCLHD